MQLRSAAFLAVLCTSLSAAAAPPSPTPGPSPAPSNLKKPLGPQVDLPPAACKTASANQTLTGNPWSFYVKSEDAAYASTECGYHIADVSFSGPIADKKVFFGAYLHNLNDPLSQKSKAACESTETTIQVFVDGQRIGAATSHGVWEERARKCELDGAVDGVGPVPMKPTFRVLLKRSVSGQPRIASGQAKQS